GGPPAGGHQGGQAERRRARCAERQDPGQLRGPGPAHGAGLRRHGRGRRPPLARHRPPLSGKLNAGPEQSGSPASRGPTDGNVPGRVALNKLPQSYLIESLKPADLDAVMEIERLSFKSPWSRQVFAEE